MRKPVFRREVTTPLCAFKDLLRKVNDGYEPITGICAELLCYYCTPNQSHMDFKEIMTDLMATWPEGTGGNYFPVPAERGCKSEYQAELTYCSMALYWVGEQGQLRIDLLVWMIGILELAEMLTLEYEMAKGGNL